MVCPGSGKAVEWRRGTDGVWYQVVCPECSRVWERMFPAGDASNPDPNLDTTVREHHAPEAVVDDRGVLGAIERGISAAASSPASPLIPERGPIRPIPPKPIMNPRDAALVPSIIRNSVEAFAERGVRPGAFLSAVLENDLKRACHSADVTNVHIIPAVAAYVWARVPEDAWGNPRAVAAWCKHRGLAGIQAGR